MIDDWSYIWNRAGGVHIWINQGYRARIRLRDLHTYRSGKQILMLSVALMRFGWSHKEKRRGVQGGNSLIIWDDAGSMIVRGDIGLLLVRRLMNTLNHMDLSSGPPIAETLRKIFPNASASLEEWEWGLDG